MAMETPPRCPPLFIRKRELTGLYSRRSSWPQPMGSGGDATPCKVTREDRRLYFLMCRVYFKAHSHTALKDVPPSTRDPKTELGCHATTHLGTVPMNGREQTQELHLSKVLPTQRHFLTSTSVTSCSRSYGGRDGYEASLT